MFALIRGLIRAAKAGMLVALAASMVLGVTAGAAHAAETAYNTKTQWLTSNPSPTMPISCVERRIQLASGQYDWEQVIGNAYTPIKRPIYLGAGWYTWRDCIDPRESDYTHTTLLIPDNPDWPLAHAVNNTPVLSSGTITWGSILDPRF